MSFKNRIVFFLSKWSVIIFGSCSLVAALVLGGHVLRDYQPAPNYANFTPFFGDYYDKGIPISAVYAEDRVPADSFFVTDKLGQPMFAPKIEGHEVIHPENRYGPKANQFLAGITAFAIQNFTFFVWPQSRWSRLHMLQPKLLFWLAAVFGALQMLLFIRDVKKEEALSRNAYKRINYIGFTMIGLQLSHLVWGFTQPYGPYIDVINPFRKQDLNMQGIVQNPFDIYWVGMGLMMLIIAQGLKYATRLRKDYDSIN